MRNVAIIGAQVKSLLPDDNSIETIELAGVPVTCGIIHTKRTHFDRDAPENSFKVLVRVQAFSCNYRDLNLIFSAVRKGGDRSFYVIGSEFTGEVVEIGREVQSVKIGDRVISDCHYTGGVNSRAAEGVPTNHGSKEYQVFHEDKVMCIPAEMPSEVAAAFTIGAQTSYSMIRKLRLSSGSNVLVTAARSNTSLFVIAALQKHRVNVYATTTSMQLADRIRALGVKEVFQFDPAAVSFTQNSELCRAASELGGFDAVIDPFFDLHLNKVLDVMAPCGRYVTCGLHDQHQRYVNPNYQFLQMNCQEVLVKAMMRNLQIIGNCLGLTEDLRQAVNDYSSGALNVVIDSVFTGSRIGDFFRRTYAAPERFGKVIYQYH